MSIFEHNDKESGVCIVCIQGIIIAIMRRSQYFPLGIRKIECCSFPVHAIYGLPYVLVALALHITFFRSVEKG